MRTYKRVTTSGVRSKLYSYAFRNDERNSLTVTASKSIIWSIQTKIFRLNGFGDDTIEVSG